MELEDITNIPNVKWMSATFSICCYALGKQEEGRKYENYLKIWQNNGKKTHIIFKRRAKTIDKY